MRFRENKVLLLLLLVGKTHLTTDSVSAGFNISDTLCGIFHFLLICRPIVLRPALDFSVILKTLWHLDVCCSAQLETRSGHGP